VYAHLRNIPALNTALATRRGEGADLGNLGSAYADLGETRRAIQFHEQALLIDREIAIAVLLF